MSSEVEELLRQVVGELQELRAAVENVGDRIDGAQASNAEWFAAFSEHLNEIRNEMRSGD